METDIILFDGICNLCNTSVQFIIKNDINNKFMFASLQSEFGQKFLKENELNTSKFNSIILIKDGKFYDKSDAALRIAKELNSPLRFLSTCLILPKFLRNFGYSVIAKNRYRWFGKKESCWIPTKELKAKFLK